jgi:hypothetical protein
LVKIRINRQELPVFSLPEHPFTLPVIMGVTSNRLCFSFFPVVFLY